MSPPHHLFEFSALLKPFSFSHLKNFCNIAIKTLSLFRYLITEPGSRAVESPGLSASSVAAGSWIIFLHGWTYFCCQVFNCQAQVRSPKVQSPKVKTKETWADTKITRVWITSSTGCITSSTKVYNLLHREHRLLHHPPLTQFNCITSFTEHPSPRTHDFQKLRPMENSFTGVLGEV